MNEPKTQGETVETAVTEHEIELILPDQVAEHLTDPELLAGHLKAALPRAVRLASKENTALSGSLKPLVEQIMEKSVRQNPNLMIEVLFPIIGSAVRKSVKETFEKMMQSLNQSMETSLTWQSFKWRMEAWRTGKRFSEVVLYNTLVFRVEQAFLVHRETGILLSHVCAESVEQGQGDLVTSMLTAIQDFVKDSFQLAEGTPVESMKVGDVEVWVESRPQVYLALVIRGNVPISVRANMERIIEDVQQQYAEELDAFEGETDTFNGCQGMLRLCLKSRRRPPASPRGGLSIVFLILFTAGLFWGRSLVENAWGNYQLKQSLSDTPGVFISEIKAVKGGYAAYGFKDPLAPNLLVLARCGGYSGKLEDRTKAFFSLEPELVVLRAQRQLFVPSSVTLALHGDILVAEGQASAEWINSLARKPLPLGVRSLDTNKLSVYGKVVAPEPEPEPVLPPPVVKPKPLPATLTGLLEQISLVNLHFSESDQVLDAVELEEIARVVAMIQKCSELAAANDQMLTVHIQSLVQEDDRRLKLIAFNRTKTVKEEMEARGLPRGFLNIKKTIAIATEAEQTPVDQSEITIIFPAELKAKGTAL